MAGAGKTDVGSMLADRLSVDFMDGDDLHPQANIDKMTSGHPLNDKDRPNQYRRLASRAC